MNFPGGEGQPVSRLFFAKAWDAMKRDWLPSFTSKYSGKGGNKVKGFPVFFLQIATCCVRNTMFLFLNIGAWRKGMVIKYE